MTGFQVSSGAAGASGREAEAGFVPPVYPYDKLAALAALAAEHEGGAVDLSVGTPCDPPPAIVLEALASSGTERGYPCVYGLGGVPRGRPRMDVAQVRSRHRRLGRRGLCRYEGARGGRSHWLRLRTPGRDTVLCPRLAYPTYEMGALLAGCRAVAVPARPDGTLDLSSISPDDAARAVCLWVNSPGNPAGQLEDLGEVARSGPRARRPGLLRRVLCRVHLAGARPHDPRARAGRPRRGPLAFETVEPRRRACRLLCR